MFTFLPQCTVHNMPISELGVPDSKKQWRSKFTEKKTLRVRKNWYLSQFYSDYGTVVNRILPHLHRRSLKIMLTVPLKTTNYKNI